MASADEVEMKITVFVDPEPLEVMLAYYQSMAEKTETLINELKAQIRQKKEAANG